MFWKAVILMWGPLTFMLVCLFYYFVLFVSWRAAPPLGSKWELSFCLLVSTLRFGGTWRGGKQANGYYLILSIPLACRYVLSQWGLQGLVLSLIGLIHVLFLMRLGMVVPQQRRPLAFLLLLLLFVCLFVCSLFVLVFFLAFHHRGRSCRQTVPLPHNILHFLKKKWCRGSQGPVYLDVCFE